MELARLDPAAAFPPHAVNARPARSRRGGEPPAGRTEGKAQRRRRPRCQCGRCARCVDNARWERIFAEKFADPDYYARPYMRCSSPLESL